VPGISAALAAPAAAGIPVTHRGLSGSVTIVNGHDPAQHAWSALAQGGGTLVFLMAVEHLEEIVAELLAHGRPADEPAALVQWATTPRQRVVAAPLADIAASARAAGVEPPAVLVVGPTAALAAILHPPPAHAQDRAPVAPDGSVEQVPGRPSATPYGLQTSAGSVSAPRSEPCTFGAGGRSQAGWTTERADTEQLAAARA